MRLSISKTVPNPLTLFTKRRPVCSLSGAKFEADGAQAWLAKAITVSEGTVSLVWETAETGAVVWGDSDSVGKGLTFKLSSVS